MKALFFYFLLFCCFHAKAQNALIRDLINQVAKEIVPSENSYYNLVDSSFIIKVDKYTLDEREKYVLLKLHPNFPISLLEQVSDSTILTWKIFKLDRARYYSIVEMPRHMSNGYRISKIVSNNYSQFQIDSINQKISSSELYVKVKQKWNERKVQKAYERAWKRNDSLIQKEDKIYFSFSTPIFSKDHKYAVVRVRYGSVEKSLIYEWDSNHWKKIYEFGLTVA